MRRDKKTETVIGISLVVIAVFAAIAVARIVFGGPEDNWICVGGQWIMHGNPAAAKPTTTCF